MEYNEAVNFVKEWLWDSKQFGSNHRDTTGMPWTEPYMRDAARMVRDAVQKARKSKELEEVKPSTLINKGSTPCEYLYDGCGLDTGSCSIKGGLKCRHGVHS